jgi:hypothetical protein
MSDELSTEKKEEYRALFNRRIGPVLEESMRNGLSGAVSWNHAKVNALLDWVEGDFAKKLLWGPGSDDESRRTLWGKFEAFSRARAAGQIDNPEVWAIFFAMLRAWLDLDRKAMEFFEVEFSDDLAELPGAVEIPALPPNPTLERLKNDS